MKIALTFGLSAAAVLAVRPAWCDEKSACLEAVAQGQNLRDEHRLVEAREQFRICASPACPAVVKADCATWAVEAERSIPTVLTSAKDAAGNDVADASVAIDGVVVASKLDGQPIAVNPGPHTFRFVRTDGTTAEQRIVLEPGRKLIPVAVILRGSVVAPAPKLAPPPSLLRPAPVAVVPAASVAPASAEAASGGHGNDGLAHRGLDRGGSGGRRTWRGNGLRVGRDLEKERCPVRRGRRLHQLRFGERRQACGDDRECRLCRRWCARVGGGRGSLVDASKRRRAFRRSDRSRARCAGDQPGRWRAVD